MGQHGYSTSVRSQYPNSVSKNELSLYEELNYCLDVCEFHLLNGFYFFKHLFEMKMCVWILLWVVKKVQCLLHEFVKFYITFFSFMFFLRLWHVWVFMFTVLSFLILNKLNFEYFYEYFSESKYKNLFTDLWQY